MTPFSYYTYTHIIFAIPIQSYNVSGVQKQSQIVIINSNVYINSTLMEHYEVIFSFSI